jgi:hypothetical protein
VTPDSKAAKIEFQAVLNRWRMRLTESELLHVLENVERHAGDAHRELLERLQQRAQIGPQS